MQPDEALKAWHGIERQEGLQLEGAHGEEEDWG